MSVRAPRKTPVPVESRRSFLKVSIGAGVGLSIGFLVPRSHAKELARSGDTAFVPDAFIRIDRSGAVKLIMSQVEMDQGVYTSISMILAEELDVDFSRVVVEP